MDIYIVVPTKLDEVVLVNRQSYDFRLSDIPRIFKIGNKDPKIQGVWLTVSDPHARLSSEEIVPFWKVSNVAASQS